MGASTWVLRPLAAVAAALLGPAALAAPALAAPALAAPAGAAGVLPAAPSGPPAAAPGLTVRGGPAGQLELAPGATTTVALTVADSGATPLQVTVTVTGLSVQAGAPRFTGEPTRGLSVLVTPAAFALAPGDERGLSVRLQAGPGVRPGGLFAGLVVRAVPPSVPGTVTVAGEVGRPLLVRVPGPVSDTGVIRGLTVRRAAHGGGVDLLVRFADTGTIDYPVAGSLRLEPSRGPAATLQLPGRTVLPGQTLLLPLTWAGPVSPGLLRARLTMTWGLHGEHTGQATASMLVAAAAPATLPGAGLGAGPAAVPVSWLVRAFAGLLVLLLLLAWLLARRRSRRAPPVAPAGPAEPEPQAVGAGRDR